MVLAVKNPPANAGDARNMSLIAGWGRSAGGGHGNPLQYSCLENLLYRGAWQAIVGRVTKSWTWLKQLSICMCIHAHAHVYTHTHTHKVIRVGFWSNKVSVLVRDTADFPGDTSGKESACQWRRQRHVFDPWVGMIPWNRKWQSAPVFLPGKFSRQGILMGYSPWCCKESDTISTLPSTHTRDTREPLFLPCEDTVKKAVIWKSGR